MTGLGEPEPHDDLVTLERLCAVMVPELMRFARRRADASLAEDIVAETLLEVWSNRPRIPSDHDGRRAFIYGVARNCIRTVRRRHEQHRRIASRLAAQPTMTASDDPEGVLGVIHAHQELKVALAALPRDDREAFLAWSDGRDIAEVARETGCTERSLRRRLGRARRALATSYAQWSGCAPRTTEGMERW